VKYKPYSAYKDSHVHWLGNVPNHWAVGNIRRYAKMKTGHTPSRNHPEYWDNCTIPWFTLADVWQLRDGKQKYLEETKEKISELGLQNSAAELLPAGTVVFSRTASVGFSGIMPIPMATTQDFWNWICSLKLIPDYLLYVFRSMEQEFQRLTMGSTHKTIYQPIAAAISICVPSQSEQRAIAAFLDRETARIDALIEKKQRQIELLQEKRAALISHAVTKGLNPNAKMKDSGIEWLGEVPEHWDVAPLYSRYIVQLGKMLDAKRITGDQLLPYLRNVDVQWDFVNVEDLPEMDISSDEYERYTLQVGDLIVCEGGEVGRTAIWHGELPLCGFQKAIHRVRPRSKKDTARFFYYAMSAAAKSGIFIANGNPNTIPHLTGEQFRVYRFPFPPVDEQCAIAETLDIETTKVDRLAEKIRGSIEKLREYRTALISAAVTGKIDVREFAETAEKGGRRDAC